MTTTSEIPYADVSLAMARLIRCGTCHCGVDHVDVKYDSATRLHHFTAECHGQAEGCSISLHELRWNGDRAVAATAFAPKRAGDGRRA